MCSPKFYFLCSHVNSLSFKGPQNTYLVIGKDPENMKFRIWSKPLALPHAGYHTCHKGAMAQPCGPQGEKSENTADNVRQDGNISNHHANSLVLSAPDEEAALPLQSPIQSPSRGCPDSGPCTPPPLKPGGQCSSTRQPSLLKRYFLIS